MRNLELEISQLESEVEKLEEQKADLLGKLKDIENNPQEYADLESYYDDMLDECYSEECEALPVSITGSQLIKEFDPIMYRCGFNDYCSGYDYSSLDVYSDTENELTDIIDQIDDLNSDIDDLQSELVGLE